MLGLHGRPKRGWAPTVLSNPLGCQVVGSQQAGGSLAISRLRLAGRLDLSQAATGAPVSPWYSRACSKLSHVMGYVVSKGAPSDCQSTAGQWQGNYPHKQRGRQVPVGQSPGSGWVSVVQPLESYQTWKGRSADIAPPPTRGVGSHSLVWGANPSCPGRCSELLQSSAWPARRVLGYPSGEVAAQCWDAGCAKLQKVAAGVVACTGAQQGTVPKWYQAGASASG